MLHVDEKKQFIIDNLVGNENHDYSQYRNDAEKIKMKLYHLIIDVARVYDYSNVPAALKIEQYLLSMSPMTTLPFYYKDIYEAYKSWGEEYVVTTRGTNGTQNYVINFETQRKDPRLWSHFGMRFYAKLQGFQLEMAQVIMMLCTDFGISYYNIFDTYHNLFVENAYKTLREKQTAI